MGGGQSKEQQILKFVEAEWEICSQNQGRTILRNIETLKQAQVCLLPLDPIHNILHQYQIYNYRRVQQEALVQVFAVEQLRSEASMCGNQQVLKVLCERIIFRLEDIQELEFADSLYVLSQSIRGYHHIFQMIGFFNITARMICLNIHGQIKVWLHNNLAQNHPIDQRPLLQKTKQNNSQIAFQQQMLQNLIKIVQERCRNGRYREYFRSRIYRKSNFIDAYAQIEQFCNQNSILVPAKLIINQFTKLKINQNLKQPLNSYGINMNSLISSTNRNNQQIYSKSQNIYPYNSSSSIIIKNQSPTKNFNIGQHGSLPSSYPFRLS